MTLKKCLFSNIRLECGLRLAPLRMQRGTQLLRSSFPRRCLCDTRRHSTSEGSPRRSGHSAAQVRNAHNGRGRRWSRPHAVMNAPGAPRARPRPPVRSRSRAPAREARWHRHTHLTDTSQKEISACLCGASWPSSHPMTGSMRPMTGSMRPMTGSMRSMTGS